MIRDEDTIEVTDEERAASDIFDRIDFGGMEPAWQDLDMPEDDEDEVSATSLVTAVNEAATPEETRAAVQADLQPLRDALAEVLQSTGENPAAVLTDARWTEIIDRVLAGESIESLLLGQWLHELLTTAGKTEADIAALIADAAASGE